MERIVQINVTCGSGSTGKICVSVSKLLTERSVENYIFYAAGNGDYPLGRRYMRSKEIRLQTLRSRIFGNYGFNSRGATKRLLALLEEIKPTIVHLHNLHGHNVHLEMLFSYLKEKKIKVYWTFHDCWAFTGYCPHFDMVGCQRWKTGCEKCPQRGSYSWFFDRSKYLYESKKKAFAGLDLTIVTPSQWLADRVKESFLYNYGVRVINNGIDLSVFYPRESDFREKYALKDKHLVLGVAFGWGRRKGLDVFCELARRLDDRFQIVLVGTNNQVDKQLPKNIISIHRTQDQVELAEIYSAADVFVNPTREENYPTTHMESIACGTPVVAFATGGCGEMLGSCGCVVPKNDIDALEKEILRCCLERSYTKEACVQWAKGFDEGDRFREYIRLYGLEE